MVEVEIRAIVNNKDDIMENLKKNGFVNTKIITQHDIILDKPDGSLFNSGKKIRIRTEGDSATLTYKGNLNTFKDISKRTELNISINSDDVESYITFLTELGFPVCFQIRKERIVWSDGKVEVIFDEWPIIGCMMEIEGPEELISKIAHEVASEVKFSNYRLKELFQNKMNETGKSLDELKADYFKENKFELGHIELIVGS
ncbi:MAG: class IV adenylate cyclase [Acetobacterium woodii]|nr:class IV adenylate cyclase [Acetobacterium woodii]